MVASKTAADPAGSVLTAVRGSLERVRRDIFREIRSYPTPIAGCDVQFNRLLEQREAIAHELDRLDALGAGPSRRAALRDLVRASPFLDETRKQSLIDALDDAADERSRTTAAAGGVAVARSAANNDSGTEE